jgi:hypothetical protein
MQVAELLLSIVAKNRTYEYTDKLTAQRQLMIVSVPAKLIPAKPELT